jgi:hypothetical protein
MEKTRLTPIRFPIDLLMEIEKFVGERQRSKFVIDAARKELIRLKQRTALKMAAGVFKAEDYPELGSPEDVSLWVRKLREETEARRRKVFGK